MFLLINELSLHSIATLMLILCMCHVCSIMIATICLPTLVLAYH